SHHPRPLVSALIPYTTLFRSSHRRIKTKRGTNSYDFLAHLQGLGIAEFQKWQVLNILDLNHRYVGINIRGYKFSIVLGAIIHGHLHHAAFLSTGDDVVVSQHITIRGNNRT